MQCCAQRTAKFEFLSLAFKAVRKQRQLVQPLLDLHGRFCHGRACCGPPTSLAPASDGFFNESGLGVMLREELGLALHELRGVGFERFGDPRVQALARATQQTIVRRVLHQRVLKGVDRVGRRAALKDQLGRDEASESGLQLVLGKAGDRAQQLV